jgi:spermidine/putrescine transport system substrate-binding protein
VAAQNEITWACPADFSGQTLHVHNWTTYIAPNTISTFATLCNVTVEYNEFNDEEAVLRALRRGESGYDLVIVDNTLIAQLVTEGLLQELNHANIPNLKHLFPNFQNPSYDPQNRHSIPYQVGTFGVGYHVGRVAKPPTSWEDFFGYAGPKAWLDFDRALLGSALVMLGHPATSQTATEIASARDYLIEHSDNTIIVSDAQGQDLLYDGTVDMVIEYSGDIFQLNRRCECEDFAYVIPSEGANMWIDAMAISINSRQQALGEAFMDFILNPVVSAEISNFTAYATPNQTAVENRLIRREYIENKAIYPDATLRARMFFLSDVPSTTQALYESAWDEIIMLIGIENYQVSDLPN